MMQDYQFMDNDTFSSTASTIVQPSEQVLQNILSFARCYQQLSVDGLKLTVFLN